MPDTGRMARNATPSTHCVQQEACRTVEKVLGVGFRVWGLGFVHAPRSNSQPKSSPHKLKTEKPHTLCSYMPTSAGQNPPHGEPSTVPEYDPVHSPPGFGHFSDLLTSPSYMPKVPFSFSHKSIPMRALKPKLYAQGSAPGNPFLRP